MLGSKKSSLSVSGATTLISRDTVVVGDLHFTGSLDVEGLVQGNIIAREGRDALVRVVEKGCVEGEIRSPSVLINGTVKGDVYSTVQLEMAPKGCVQGNVFYALLEMAAGSQVNGNLTHVVPPREKEKGVAPDPGVEAIEAGAEQDTPPEVASNKVD